MKPFEAGSIAALLLCCFVKVSKTGYPDPDLSWSFDRQCSVCPLCYDSTPVNSDYRLTGRCSEEAQVEEGVIGHAIWLEGQQLEHSWMDNRNSCITVLDKPTSHVGPVAIKECTGFTLTFWIKLHSVSVIPGFLFKTTTYPTEFDVSFPETMGVSISVNARKYIKAKVQTPGVYHEKEISTPIDLDVWTYLTLVWAENHRLKVYLNATLADGSDKKYDYPNSKQHNNITIGQKGITNFTIDDLKIWFRDYQAENVTELFRLASIDPADFTTVPPTTSTEETTRRTTTRTTSSTTTSTTTTTTVSTTTQPLYVEVKIPPLKNVSQNLYENQVTNKQKNLTDIKTLEDSSEKTIEITVELAEIIKDEEIQLEANLAISYISAVSETTNTFVAEQNANTWQQVSKKTKKLNEIIETADNVTKTLVDSMAPQVVEEIQVVQKESISLMFVPTQTEEPVTISPSENVEVGLPSSTVMVLSQNTPVVVAASIHSGAETCYDDILPIDVDIIDHEDPTLVEPYPSFDNTKPLKIITEIVSVNINPRPVNEQIKLSFKHIRNISSERDFTLYCAYINKLTSKWTNHHCKIISTNDTHTTFVTRHLTNFAILMQVVDFEIDDRHSRNLSLITYIGCSISIFCLMLSLCVFALVNNIQGHRTERYHLHANLALAMLLGQVTFLAGAGYPPGTNSCKATAILLHFFYLSAFSWMLVEGSHLYNLVVKVFRSAQSKLGYYYMAGWGTPLLICVISVAAAFRGYGQVKNCWLDTNNTRVIWAFVGPALFVILVNIIILIKVTRVITTLAKSQDNCIKCMTDKATIVICAKAIAVLMPILGVTWVFGVLAVNEDTIIFQYIFAVCNSLQGFFLFMFHCVFNSETRASLMYRTKSFRSDFQSRSATHSRSRRQTKVELVNNADQLNATDAVDTGSTVSQHIDCDIHGQMTSYGTPSPSRRASHQSEVTNLQAKSNNSRPASVGSRTISTRKVKPNVVRAW